MRQDAPETLLPSLLALAREAGRAIMAVYESDDPQTQLKGDRSPLTAADLAAHRCLAAGLAAVGPLPVVSEEDAASMGARTTQSRYWLVDPLDGTREFLDRNGEFTVNIALIEQGRAVLGVVHAPATGGLYWGGPSVGAWREVAGRAEPIRVRPAPTGHPYRVIASKSHLNEATQAFIGRLGACDLVQAGSSLKFCRIAEGEADLYPRLAPTCEWDTAAAQAVLEGAGGAVIDLHGQPLRYGKPDPLNPSFVATRDRGLLPHA